MRFLPFSYLIFNFQFTRWNTLRFCTPDKYHWKFPSLRKQSIWWHQRNYPKQWRNSLVVIQRTCLICHTSLIVFGFDHLMHSSITVILCLVISSHQHVCFIWILVCCFKVDKELLSISLTSTLLKKSNFEHVYTHLVFIKEQKYMCMCSLYMICMCHFRRYVCLFCDVQLEGNVI